MIYTLEDLLTKMGAPEVRENGAMRWHYFDKAGKDTSGFAEIRLIDDGERLIAELTHPGQPDEKSGRGSTRDENFYLHAQKRGRQYKVTKIAFDGEEYVHPQKSIVELGLSIFHARVLNISILMIEQAFNKGDILDTNGQDKEEAFLFEVTPTAKAPTHEKSWGVVIPFAPRAAAKAKLLTVRA